MSPEEGQLADALARCRMRSWEYNRRFSRDLAAMAHQQPCKDLTENQRLNLLKLVIRYRRQIPSAVVELAKRMQAAEPVDSVHED